MEWICPDGIIPDSGLSGLNNIYIYIYIYIYTNPSVLAECDTSSVFKQGLIGMNSEFSFSLIRCHTQVKEFSLSYYLSIAGGWIDGFIPFLGVLALCEM